MKRRVAVPTLNDPRLSSYVKARSTTGTTRKEVNIECRNEEYEQTNEQTNSRVINMCCCNTDEWICT